MEELQDAIEDAQYVNAIATQDDGPRPILAWEFPEADQLEEWVTAKLAKDPACFKLQWTLEEPIGYFLFSSFIKEIFKDYVRINFCEDVLRFRKLQGKPRLKKARDMVKLYLSAPLPKELVKEQQPQPQEEQNPVAGKQDLKVNDPAENGKGEHRTSVLTENTTPSMALTEPGDSGNITSTNNDSNPSSNISNKDAGNHILKHVTHVKSEINEHDLARTPTHSSLLRPEEMQALVSHNMDYPKCLQSPIGLCGPIYKELCEDFKEIENLYKSLPASFMAQEAATRSHAGGSDRTEETGENLNGIPAKLSASQHITGTSRSTSMHGAVFRNVVAHKTASQSFLVAGTVQEQQRYEELLKMDIFEKAEVVVIESLRRDYWDEFVASSYFMKLKNFLWYRDRPVVPDDFFVLRPLGRGGFGLVTACKKGTSGKLYAMKVMNKRRIKMKQAEKLALNERQALAAVESNFVCNLKYSFHNKEEVFLVLDLMTGGDLGYHLQKKGRFPKRECVYYAARIMLGLQALHDKKYVYRDLKPENCLLADDGRVKITDLGLATKITPNLHGAAGTRGYWAPEMLRRDAKGKRMNYGHTVDWFSFGCCVAEFISGSNPFRSEAALNFGLERGKQTKEKAIDCATMEMDPEFPSDRFEPDAADLCRRLLDKNETTRLGYKGCEEIMAHPWFERLRWEDIISDKKEPPFIPPTDVNAISQQEIGTFAEDRAYQETVVTPEDDDNYKNWDWTNPRAFAAEVIEFLIYERETGEPLLPVAQHASCCCNVL